MLSSKDAGSVYSPYERENFSFIKGYEGAVKTLEALFESTAKRKKTRRKKEKKLTSRSVTRKDYPSIVTMKIAGRSDEEIARRFGTPEEKIKGHISRAMADFRRGEVKAQAGEAVQEARKKGSEKSKDFKPQLRTNSGVLRSSFGFQSSTYGPSSFSTAHSVFRGFQSGGTTLSLTA